MNEELKAHINESLKKGVRIDGRKNEEFREITVETGVIATAEGSARVKAGSAELLVGVKMSVGTPYDDSPDSGVLMVGTEMLPLSNPEFESGPPGIDSIEASRVIDRAIRESQAIDLKKLCIESGEKVWMVAVDIVPINFDGNIIDLGALGAIAALKTVEVPEYKDGKINLKKKTGKIAVAKEPISITVVKIGDNYVIDPTESEEKVLDARLTVGLLKDGTPCSMQKGGDAPLTEENIKEMVELAVKKGAELRKKAGL